MLRILSLTVECAYAPFGRATTYLKVNTLYALSLHFLISKKAWTGKERTLLIDPVLDLVLGGGGRVRTCSLQVMGLTSRPITLPRYRSKPGSNYLF